MTDLVIRPLTAGEEDLFESLPDPGIVGFAAFGDTYTEMAAAGQYRPEWTSIALREGVVVARAAWWAGAEYGLERPPANHWTTYAGSPAHASGGAWPTTAAGCAPDALIWCQLPAPVTSGDER